MATIKDIANKLGIAVSTVSKGINGANDISSKMRQLVLDTAVEMGYISKKMKTDSERKLCIFIKNIEFQNKNQFGYDIIVGFKLSAARRHWEVTIVPTNPNLQTTEKYDTYMLRNGYCGAFLLGFEPHDNWIKQLSKTNVPTVLLDNYIERNNHIGYVGTDHLEGIDLAVGHLYSLGHTRIAFLNGPLHTKISEQRHQSFIISMNNRGLMIEDNLIKNNAYEPYCVKDHISDLIKNRVSAIMCATDLIAAEVIHEIKKLGLSVPEDISVIGFDDLPIAASLTPPLTTIHQDRLNIGKSAFLLLDGLIHNVTISKLLLRAKFIPRESTGPCKKGK